MPFVLPCYIVLRLELPFLMYCSVAAALLQTIPKALFQLGQQLDSAFAAGVLDGLVFVDHRATATSQTLDFVTQYMLTPLQGRRPTACHRRDQGLGSTTPASLHCNV